jgi:hypothetical protein
MDVSAVITSRTTDPVVTGGRSLLRLLATAALFLLVVIAVLGFRTMMQSQAAVQAPAAAAGARAAFPTNGTIEDRWGVRFTAVNVLADGGVLEVRYIVLDPAKGGRLNSANLSDLPYLKAEDTGKEVRGYSLMFHLHANHVPNEVDGRNYSLIFGNSNGAIHSGGTVTLTLADGLRLEHVPVT